VISEDSSDITEGSTSARGALLEPAWRIIVVGGALAMPSTSSYEPDTPWEDQYVYETQTTASHSSRPRRQASGEEQQGQSTASALSELRRISGLTWDQLGRLFHVSRRSVHFWASGKPLNADNEARLHRVLDVIRHADRGSAGANRTALLRAVNGRVPFELLASQELDEARELLDRGVDRPLHHGELSAAAKDARRPPPPETLVDARHDGVYRDMGRGRAARTARNQRRGRGG
jgi:DNA-binding transcriptional regulator YiaG